MNIKASITIIKTI